MTKPIDWRGSSFDDLRAFPDDAKRNAGYQLRKVQRGEQPDVFKPMEMKTAHHDTDLKSRHVTPADGNVFADLGFSPKEAKALLKNADARIAKAQRLKEEAATAIAQWIQAKKLTQVAASEILDVSRPRVSDLVNLKLGRFSLDTLVAMLLRTGKKVDLVVR
jgi:predicted XRE-type DNA-binding protein